MSVEDQKGHNCRRSKWGLLVHCNEGEGKHGIGGASRQEDVIEDLLRSLSLCSMI